MTAKEMFEELGYEQVLYQDGNQISYEIDSENSESINYFIFYKKEKKVDVALYVLSPQHVKAIHQQMKELGWIE